MARRPKTIRNPYLDQLRVFLCLAVLLYHLGILKGGYLAVCGFFVLSGYMSTGSLRRKKKFSYKEYYLKRAKRLYLPLLIMVFMSVSLIGLIPGIVWADMKNETTSVIFAYNNFYQLINGSDYFARASDTPFTHMWYIAILLQLDLLLPPVYVLLRKAAKTFSRIIPLVLLATLAIISALVFYHHISRDMNMNAYYGTFDRSFAFLSGMAMAFAHFYILPMTIRNRAMERILFYLEGSVLLLLFIMIDASSASFAVSMFIVTFLCMRLIDHAIYLNDRKNRSHWIVGLLSTLSYEIYLVQYPIIFVLHSFDIPGIIRIILSFVLTFIMAIILKLALSFEKPSLKKIYKPILSLLVIVLSLSGIYRYVTGSDNRKQMEELQDKLDENQKLIEERNREFEEKEKAEEEKWKELYESDGDVEEITKKLLQEMPLIGIGDSIMIDIAEEIYDHFPNAYIDGKISRDLLQGNQILKQLKNEGKLKDNILLSLSVNGDFHTYLCEELLEIVDGRDVYWIDAVGADDPSFNRLFEDFASAHDNIHIIHWQEYSKDHPEYFYYDGIHVIEEGVTALNRMIYDTIYQNCLKNFEERRNQALNQKEAEEKKKFSFYGNDLLTGVYPYLKDHFAKASFILLADLKASNIISRMEKDKEDGVMEYQVVIVFDASSNLSQKDYERIISSCGERKIHIFDLYGKLKDPGKNDVTVIDLSGRITGSKENLLSDGLHLSEEGNILFSDAILEALVRP